MDVLRLKGEEARPYARALAELRLKVFWDFPYLYEGTEEYEMKYLETYFKANDSFILLLKDHHRIIGATTSILASEEEDSFKKPFLAFGLDPATVFYFGESVLLPEYRGKGLGKIFFNEREKFAKTLPQVRTLSFCAVVREDDHPLRPVGYMPLNSFWESQGFRLQPGLTTAYEWQDRNEATSTAKKMQYWIKNI